MADLSTVSGRADEGPAVHDDTATHADLAGDEQHITLVDRSPAPQLRERSEVRFIGYRDRGNRRHRLRDACAEGRVGPTQVGGHLDETVAATNDTGDRHADADERVSVRHPFADGLGQLCQILDGLFEGEATTGPFRSDLVADPATQSDRCGRERVDRDLERQHDGAFGLRPNQGRRSARSAARDGALLACESE